MSINLDNFTILHFSSRLIYFHSYHPVDIRMCGQQQVPVILNPSSEKVTRLVDSKMRESPFPRREKSRRND